MYLAVSTSQDVRFNGLYAEFTSWYGIIITRGLRVMHSFCFMIQIVQVDETKKNLDIFQNKQEAPIRMFLQL